MTITNTELSSLCRQAGFPLAAYALREYDLREPQRKAWRAFNVRGVFIDVNGDPYRAPEILTVARRAP